MHGRDVYPTIAAKSLPERHGRRVEGDRSRRGGIERRGRGERVVSAEVVAAVAGRERIGSKIRAGASGRMTIEETGENRVMTRQTRPRATKRNGRHLLGETWGETTAKGLEELAPPPPARPALRPLPPTPTYTSAAPPTPPPPSSLSAPDPSRWTYHRVPRSRFSGPVVYTPLTLYPPRIGLGITDYVGTPPRRGEGDTRWTRPTKQVYPPTPNGYISSRH